MTKRTTKITYIFILFLDRKYDSQPTIREYESLTACWNDSEINQITEIVESLTIKIKKKHTKRKMTIPQITYDKID